MMVKDISINLILRGNRLIKIKLAVKQNNEWIKVKDILITEDFDVKVFNNLRNQNEQTDLV